MSEVETRRIFQSRFNNLLDTNRISQKEIARICQVSTSTVSTWSQGQNIPRMDKIERLAEYFGLPKSYFIEAKKPTVNETDIKAAFFEGLSDDLTPKERDEYWNDARAYLRFKLSQRKKKE